MMMGVFWPGRRIKDESTWNGKGNALKALGRTTEADDAFAKAKELGWYKV